MNFLKRTTNKKSVIIISSLIFVALAVLLIFKLTRSKPEIIAKVGDREITKNDFLLNYEFGLPHLKIGNTTLERKKNYLQFMINEYLLALDAEEKGLNNAPEVKFQTEKTRRELLIESIIDNDIKPNIEVSMDEIKDAINKSKVSFKFFFWPEKDIKNARIIKKMFEENGIEETFKKLSGKKSDFHFDISKYTSEYLTWLDIPKETLNAIKDLPAFQFSDPVKIDGLYYIFQIQDIRRESVTTNEYLNKAPTFRKILYNQKFKDEIDKYVDKLMTPKKIRTKIKVFNVFASAVIDWYRSKEHSSLGFDEWVKAHEDTASVKKYIDYQDSVFITYNGGNFTLGEFKDHFYFDRIEAEYQTEKQFKNHLNTVLMISIRDYFMEQEALKEGYDQTPHFKHELMKWSSKFAFEENLSQFMQQGVTDSVKVKDRINIRLDSLRMKYTVVIDSTMLDTLKVNETKKSKQSFVQLMKSGVNQLAEPIVDGHWTSIAK